MGVPVRNFKLGMTYSGPVPPFGPVGPEGFNRPGYRVKMDWEIVHPGKEYTVKVDRINRVIILTKKE